MVIRRPLKTDLDKRSLRAKGWERGPTLDEDNKKTLHRKLSNRVNEEARVHGRRGITHRLRWRPMTRSLKRRVSRKRAVVHPLGRPSGAFLRRGCFPDRYWSAVHTGYQLGRLKMSEATVWNS